MRQTTNNVLYSWKMVLVFALRGAHMHTLTGAYASGIYAHSRAHTFVHI